MEEQAPYVVATAATPAALAPYAAVLQAEGFQVEDWAPTSLPSLYSTWEPAPQVYYFCDLALVDGKVHAGLMRKRNGEWAFRLFHWMRVDTPEELRWLLQRSVRLQQAHANPAHEAAIHGLLQTTDAATAAHLPHLEDYYRLAPDRPNPAAARA